MNHRPFPIDLLPDVLRQLVTQSARSIDCDESMVALPALSACAAAIGNQRVLQLKEGWAQPSCLWTLIVAPTGNAKTGAFDYALAPLVDWQQRRFATAAEERRSWQPGNGPEPRAERLVIEVATEEAIIGIAAHSPRALISSVDEAATWFEHGAYHDSKGSAERFWLKAWDVGPYTVDTLKRGTIHVPRLNVSVCAAIQPAGFRRYLQADRVDRGEMARMLIVQLPPRASRTNSNIVSPSALENYRQTVERLLRLGGNLTDPDRLGSPLPIALARPSWDAFERASNRWADRLEDAPQDANAERALLAKAKAHCARLALVLHVVQIESVGEALGDLDAGTMDRAVQLTDWLLESNLEAYSQARLSPAERRDSELIEWIKGQQANGVKVTVRHAARTFPAFRRSKSPTASMLAAQELQRLADAGWLQRKQVNAGQPGPPEMAFLYEEQPEPTPLE